NEKAAPAQTAEVDDALVRLRHVLLDYRFALGRPRRPARPPRRPPRPPPARRSLRSCPAARRPVGPCR
ncbi:hypothetical protein C5E16_09555, partial [Clavibacter michiganensis]